MAATTSSIAQLKSRPHLVPSEFTEEITFEFENTGGTAGFEPNLGTRMDNNNNSNDNNTSNNDNTSMPSPGAIAIAIATPDKDQTLDQYDSETEGPPVNWWGHVLNKKDAILEGQVLKAGYLMKKGERLKIWKKRWFVLRTSKLAYYKDSKEYELLRIVDMRDMHRAAELPAKHKVAPFVILTPKRTITVQAETPSEMREWIHAINQAKVHFDFTASSSDLESFAGSTVHLGQRQPPQSPLSNHYRLPLPQPIQTTGVGTLTAPITPVESTSPTGVLLPRRHKHEPLSITDPTLLKKREESRQRSSNAPKAGSNSSHHSTVPPSPISIPNSLLLPSPSLTPPSSQVSGSPGNASPRLTTSILDRRLTRLEMDAVARPFDGISKITTAVQSIQIASPSSPVRINTNGNESSTGGQEHHHIEELTSGPPYDMVTGEDASRTGSYSIPGTPSSPTCFAGDFFWTGCSTGVDYNMSSGDEEVLEDEDPSAVLEAARIAAEVDAPGSGIVTDEQIDSTIVRQGYLLKFGNKYKTWRRKWFVLRGDKLTYYKNTKEYQPHGIIPLSTIIDCLQTDPVSKSKVFCLRIVTVKRSFVCCAPDEETLLRWLDALQMECGRVTEEAHQEAITRRANNQEGGEGDGADGGDEGDSTEKKQKSEGGSAKHIRRISSNHSNSETVQDGEVIEDTKPLGRTARLRMSLHNTLPRPRSISRSRTKSQESSGSTTSGGGSSNTLQNGGPQVRKVLSLETAVSPTTMSTATPGNSGGPSVSFHIPGLGQVPASPGTSLSSRS